MLIKVNQVKKFLKGMGKQSSKEFETALDKQVNNILTTACCTNKTRLTAEDVEIKT